MISQKYFKQINIHIKVKPRRISFRMNITNLIISSNLNKTAKESFMFKIYENTENKIV